MMKKSILFVILLTFSTVAFSKVVSPEIPTSDIEGSEDYALLKRYTGSFIIQSIDQLTHVRF